jgi:Leucine-rich repeat (LRR) protein
VKTSAVDPAFIKEVAALPPEQQVARVVAKLKELNPGFDGAEKHLIAKGQVARLEFSARAVKDISPVRALQGLESLTCSDDGVARSSSLSPLADLSPLRGLRMTTLVCNHTEVSDLSPLVGMPLVGFQCNNCPVSDLTPLRGMPLRTLRCNRTRVSDLSPLVGMPLSDVECDDCPVADLTPLHGMPLQTLCCNHTNVSDLSPIKDAPLKKLRCDFDPKRHTEILRSIKTLEEINGLPVAELWKQVEAGKIPSPR